MMEKAHTRKRHCNFVFITAVNHYIVAYGTARLGNKADAAAAGALNIVVEREKRVGTD